MATMEARMLCRAVQTNASAGRWLLGYCVRSTAWEMLATRSVRMGGGFSLTREDLSLL